jgi:single-strand DNA-binding protein
MYQQMTIVGNVGRDPEVRFTPQGVAVCDFSVAVNKEFTTSNGESRTTTVWFRVTCWRKLAEVVGKYVTKGKQLLVVGEITTSAYVDKAGLPQATIELTAQTIKFLGKREDGQPHESHDEGGSGEPAPQSNSRSDDIPF